MSQLDESNKRINRSIGQRVKESQRSIARRYAITINEIQLLLAQVYEKYEKDGVLTYEEMATFDRLTTLFQNIDTILSKNYQELYQIIYAALGYSYNDAYNLTAWTIENVVRNEVGYGTVSAAQVAAAVTAPIAGLTLSQRLERDRKNVVKNIRNKVVVGLTEGQTYRTMAQAIAPILDNDLNKAVRVARTEGHRIMEAGKLDSMKHADDNGVKMLKRWNTSQDSRVRHRPKDKADHKMLEGVKLPMNEDFVGLKGKGPGPGHMHDPAEDINCRCYLSYEIATIEVQPRETYTRVAFEQWENAKKLSSIGG